MTCDPVFNLKKYFFLFVSSDIKKRSKAESSKFQDDFDVYAQALISQSLDVNFLEEVYADKGKSCTMDNGCARIIS